MIMSKTKYNDQEDQQEASDEQEYLTDHQYEQERFTDAYHEDFRDDYNEVDRF
jgi:hypothetical protein